MHTGQPRSARLAVEQGDLERGTAPLEEGVVLFREARHKQGLADALDNLGIAQNYGENSSKPKPCVRGER